MWCFEIDRPLPRGPATAGIPKDLAHCLATKSHSVMLCRLENKICIIVDSSSADTSCLRSNQVREPGQSIAPSIATPGSTLPFGRYP